MNDDSSNELVRKLEALRAAVSVSVTDAEFDPASNSELDPVSQEVTELSTPLIDLLRAKSQLKEQPFTSDVPIIGPLIARLRQMWNNVSTIWYVRPLIQQQNEFNHLVVQWLVDVETTLEEVETMTGDSDRESVALARQVAESNSLLIRLDQRLDAIETRIIESERSKSLQ